MRDVFLTIGRVATAEPPKTKGSRFIGHVAPVFTEAEALAVVETVRKEHYAARHHVWGFRLGPEGDVWRGSDDGEPNGTGSRPLLQELESRDLTDAVVVVTRYYGGTKLGTGGLARAYGEAAALALDAAPLKQRTVQILLALHFGFADTSAAMRTLDAFDAEIRDQVYAPEGTSLTLAVRQSQADALVAAFVEATAGRGRAERT